MVNASKFGLGSRNGDKMPILSPQNSTKQHHLVAGKLRIRFYSTQLTTMANSRTVELAYTSINQSNNILSCKRETMQVKAFEGLMKLFHNQCKPHYQKSFNNAINMSKNTHILRISSIQTPY